MSAEVFGWTFLFLMVFIARGVVVNGMNVVTPSWSTPRSIWCGIIDFAIIGHVDKTINTTTHNFCRDACETHPQCTSSNYATRSGVCELNNATHYDNPDALTERRGWFFAYTCKQDFVKALKPEESRTSMEQSAKGNLSWPLGMYGLPMPVDGCPTNAGFTWETGSRYHDTEDTNPSNMWSDNLHLKGYFGKNNMVQHFCMKTVAHVNEDDVEWPSGEYCVFRSEQDCPGKMSPGYVFWDDEDSNNGNDISGTLPSGQYDDNTRIDYCCMTDGNASDPITLPTYSPFYLFAFTAQCQEIQDMTVSQEFFQWDTENDDNNDDVGGSHPYRTSDNTDHRIYICFYTRILRTG